MSDIVQLDPVAAFAERIQDIDNPYWDELKPHVRPTEEHWSVGLQVGSFLDHGMWLRRDVLVHEYSWSITDPATVGFVALHAGTRVLDPMAGTGYWAYLLRQLGISALAYDAHPPNMTVNAYHRAGLVHCRVGALSGATAARRHGSNRTLLLSWPPYNTADGLDILTAFTGDRVIYIGEGDGGCTGDERMHDLLGDCWDEVACHQPVRYFGIRDFVTVYDRKRREITS